MAILIRLIGVACILGISMLTMINGWGLEIKSLGWVLAGGIAAMGVGGLFSAVASSIE